MPRKEVNLSLKTIKKLQKLADDDSRKLKPFIEKILDEYPPHHKMIEPTLDSILIEIKYILKSDPSPKIEAHAIRQIGCIKLLYDQLGIKFNEV